MKSGSVAVLNRILQRKNSASSPASETKDASVENGDERNAANATLIP